MTRRALPVVIVLYIYNIVAFSNVFEIGPGADRPKITFLLIFRKYTFFQWILTFFTFTKNLLENPDFTFVTRLRRNDRAPVKKFSVCSHINIFFAHFIYIYLSTAECAPDQVTKPDFRS